MKDMRETFQATMPTFRGRLSKQSLKQAEVIAQVDEKFVFARVPVHGSDEGRNTSYRQALVLIDQHAADERCRVEKLFGELCCAESTEDGVERLMVPYTVLAKAVYFLIPRKEQQLFEANRNALKQWGIHYSLPKRRTNSNQDIQLSVTALPSLIAERCRVEPKLLIELLRAEVWARNEKGKRPNTASSTGAGKATPINENRPTHLQERTKSDANPTHFWLRHIASCPQGIIDMLNSRSCRSAIMFNDVLSIDECKNLTSRLAECAFPFQCAHGRPSVIPLVELGDEAEEEGGLVSGLLGRTRSTAGNSNGGVYGDKSGLGFGAAWGQWMGGEGSEE
jgi:DNA mismatch repair protein MLH3